MSVVTIDLKQKVIVITGGSSGIGKATALECFRQGANIAIVANHQYAIDHTVKEISELKVEGRAIFKGYCCDISDKAAVTKIFDQIFTDFGHVDVLINNAGFATYLTFHDSTLDELDRLTQVNYLGAMYCSKLVLDQMTKLKSGHIVNVASVAGILPITPNATYGAAKQATVALTETLRNEYAPFKIKFSLMLPGRVDTAFFDHESFKKRGKRPEHAGMLTSHTIALKIIEQIKTQRELVITPRIFRIIGWLYAAFPMICKPFLRHVLKKRIEEYYVERDGSSR